MRLYRHIFLIFAVAAAFAQSLLAQNLDPTVEVNRAYEGKLMEVHKPVLKMEVPDSVMQFDLDFDYSVFESPYKGSYEFNPYLLSMKPGRTVDATRRFYLRAGAGYQLHPQLDLVWSPKLGKGFKMDVYAMHRSFVGNYWNIGAVKSASGELMLSGIENGDKAQTWRGYDMLSQAGFDAKHDWKKGVLNFGASYYGMAQKDRQWSRSYNALDAYVGFGNKGDWEQSFLYDLRMDYRYGADRHDIARVPNYNEHIFGLDVSMGPVFKENHKVLFDLGLDMTSFMKNGSIAYAIPHYVFEKGPFMFDAGLRLALLLHRYDMGDFSSNGQLVYPDIKFHIAVVPDALRLYMNAGGGAKLNTYSSLIASDHHIVNGDLFGPLLDYSVERVSLAGGLEGRISSRFSYNLRAGYVNYANEALQAAAYIPSCPNVSGVVYAPYQKWYAGLDWCLDVEGFRFDGSAVYTDAWGDVFERPSVFSPAALTGNVAVEYNWKRRIFIGSDCEFSTARKVIWEDFSSVPYLGIHAYIPGYADLGVYAEYVTSRNLSFWLRGGNLLDMTIQRSPLYAEKGPYFTLGICLNL